MAGTSEPDEAALQGRRSRTGPFREPLETGRSGTLFKLAKMGVLTGLALRLARPRGDARVHHVASMLYLASGLAFRFAWVRAGRASARDDEQVAPAGRAPLKD